MGIKDLKRLRSIVQFIWHHPLASKNRTLAFYKFLDWQIKQKFFPASRKVRLIENSYLIAEKGMAGATGNIYTGLHEFSDMAFLLHFLQQGDIFVDVGANIGAYTILASKNKGAKTYCFEPDPSTFDKLKRNVSVNQVEVLVYAANKGVGERAGVLKFSHSLDTLNHVLNEDTIGDSQTIDVVTLDETLKDHIPYLMKIDVEGFELPVLKGADKILSSQQLKALIVELNGSGVQYGYSDDDLHSFLLERGFASYTYDPFLRNLSPVDTFGPKNTLYLRDLRFIEDRIRRAEKFSVFGQSI